MERQLNKLTTLTSDLLDISKIQTGKFILREDIFDLAQTVRETVDNLSGTTSTHKLLLDCPINSIPTFGDKDRIEQVLINLLTNAIKYSPNAEKVMISVSADQQNACIRVQDFGIGISKDHQQHIFECFYQAAEPGEKTFPGLGMGLFITNEIIQQHHGRIWIESTEGVGSIFSFTLPLRQDTMTVCEQHLSGGINTLHE